MTAFGSIINSRGKAQEDFQKSHGSATTQVAFSARLLPHPRPAATQKPARAEGGHPTLVWFPLPPPPWSFRITCIEPKTPSGRGERRGERGADKDGGGRAILSRGLDSGPFIGTRGRGDPGPAPASGASRPPPVPVPVPLPPPGPRTGRRRNSGSRLATGLPRTFR